MGRYLEKMISNRGIYGVAMSSYLLFFILTYQKNEVQFSNNGLLSFISVKDGTKIELQDDP